MPACPLSRSLVFKGDTLRGSHLNAHGLAGCARNHNRRQLLIQFHPRRTGLGHGQPEEEGTDRGDRGEHDKTRVEAGRLDDKARQQVAQSGTDARRGGKRPWVRLNRPVPFVRSAITSTDTTPKTPAPMPSRSCTLTR
jgi:hypothetical protein